MSDFKGPECCRLCSADKNLIAMFGGKSLTLRDTLRKMIEETLHIQIEQYDSVSSVCFNCSIDVSNFYFFKLHCLKNEKDLKDIQTPMCEAKKPKLQSSYLKDVERPNIKSAETVLNWLNSKRVGLMTSEKILLDKDSQTIQILYDVAIQSEVIETFPKDSQTINLEVTDSATQCDNPYASPKVSVKARSSQTISTEKRPQCPNCTKQNGFNIRKKKIKSHHTQTKATSYCDKSFQTCIKVVSCLPDNTFKPKPIKDSSCQTDTTNVEDKICQTKENKLTKTLSKVCTLETFAQTNMLNLVNKHTQCDILKLNGFKNSVSQIRETRNNFKTTDHQTFTDTLLIGFDNIFVSTTSETEMSMNSCDQNFSNISYCSNKDSYLLSPSTGSSKDTKLDIKIPFSEKVKEEKLSPSESPTKEFPINYGMLSPHSSGLLQVNSSKTDKVKICKLCDKSLYNKKEVVMHNKMHMQCNICRRKFRSLKAAQAHISNCKVKQISITPFVSLVRIDQITEMKEQYFGALDTINN